MAGGPGGPIKPHVPGIYRFTATALGASMWFFVRAPPSLRPKMVTSVMGVFGSRDTDRVYAADVPGEEGWYVILNKAPRWSPADDEPLRNSRSLTPDAGAVLMGWKHPWDH